MKRLDTENWTEEQKEILDLVYECNTYDQLMDFLSCLDRPTKFTAMSIVKLIMYEQIEEEYIKTMDRFPDAEMIWNRLYHQSKKL